MDEKDLLRRIDASTAAHRADILADLAALIAIPSVQGEAAPGAPFGPEDRWALDAALAMARRC